jgi:parallel beta-helix repeat protein
MTLLPINDNPTLEKGEIPMTSSKLVPLLLCLILVSVEAGRAEDISGTIAATRTIVNDSQLVGNVTCTTIDGPCILFGAPGIKLSLNGFTITGPANPDDSSTCQPTGGNPPADGITNANTLVSPAVSQTDVQILGPGMVQKFRRHGILIVGTAGVGTRVTVKNVTSHHNCFSGLFTNGMTDSVIEGVVSVRNAVNSGVGPCGGNCIVSSNNNVIRKNQFSGNGSVGPAATFTAAAVTVASNNDFGVGLTGTSSGNLIETNTIGGNANGILIQAGASGNVIRQNIIAGNAPSQVTRDYGPIGFDIKDESATNGSRNTIQGNHCVTYFGPGPNACPNFLAGDVTTILTPLANPPSATGLTFTASTISAGSSFTATFAGSNLTASTNFDVRFRNPGSTTDVVALNWQQGASAAHSLPAASQTGTWTVTGVRAHSSTNDGAGPFATVSLSLTVP